MKNTENQKLGRIDNKDRVGHGVGWHNAYKYCHCNDFGWFFPVYQSVSLGFRLVVSTLEVKQF